MMSNSFIQVPPDGAGKKIYTQQHDVDANTVQIPVHHIADHMDPSKFLAIDNRGSASVRFAEGQPALSGFGSLKIAEEVAIGVYESSLDTYASLFTKFVVGGGSFSYDVNESSEILVTDGVNGSSIRMTSNRCHYYLPGTSNVFKMTMACGDSGKTGNLRRWGAFDENDGLFFELHETTLNVVIRSSVSGSVVETKVPRNLWNADRLDGTGLSSYTLDVTKINVWWLDYQWLGAGRVRFGIYAPDGSRVVCHTFQNAGTNSLPYMQTGTLPVSAENTNFGTTGSTSELRTVCCGVYAEGDVLNSYTFWRYSTGLLSKTVATPQTLVAAYRPVATLNGKRNRVQIYPETLNVYTTAPIGITLFQTSDYTGGTWSNAGAGSVLERSTDGTFVYANSESFTTFFCDTGVSTFDLTRFFELNDEGIQVDAAGVPQIWSLLASPLGANPADIKVNISYKELY
jgi:hypothetical protein